MITPDSDIGGAIVRRRFTFGQRAMLAGDKLTREQVLSMPRANRNSMIENRFLQVVLRMDAGSAEPGERYAVHMGRGKYDVIEGRKLNDAPLTAAEAKKLAAQGPKATKAH